MRHAKLILTDSGGIQEEATAFGTPILVLRHKTERMEGVRAGFAKLVGTKSEDIINAASEILILPKAQSRIHAKNPYGDGKAALKIEKIIRRFLYE